MCRCPDIDTIVLACTHYPLLADKIRRYLPEQVNLIAQGAIVGASLESYLERHPEIETLCSRNSSAQYLTTESGEKFRDLASVFLGELITATRITL